MKTPALLACVLFCLAFAAPGRAGDAAGSPEGQAHAFYSWYLHELNAGGEPMTGKRAALSKYVSARFLREIARLSKVEGGIEADPFLCAQDWDKQWEKHIAVSGVVTEGERAHGQVMLKGPEMNSDPLRVEWVREAGAWKIDRVRARGL